MIGDALTNPVDVTAVALDALSSFFDNHWMGRPAAPGILAAAIAQSNAQLGTAIDAAATPSDTIEGILDALEESERFPLNEADGRYLNLATVGSLADVHRLLTALLAWLDQLMPPAKRFQTDRVAKKAPRVSAFCEMIAPQRLSPAGGSLTVGILSRIEGVEFADSDSWLFVRSHGGDVSMLISCDDDKISRSSSDKWLVENRFARLKLHEMGHARCDMDYYLQQPAGVRSRPVHETRAWHYANTICSIVSSLRSRVERLLTTG